MPPVSRRRFLAATGAIAVAGCTSTKRAATSWSKSGADSTSAGVWVNDVHSQLNRTHVASITRPRDLDELRRTLTTMPPGQSASVCGGRHAGGGQQFRSDRLLIDTTALNRVISFDRADGSLEVEAGISWPAVMSYLAAAPGRDGWAIRQKQGGADEVTLGGAIGSNIHSRHLSFRPFVQDVISMKVLLPDGSIAQCDRDRHTDLFRKVMGGYGLLGIVCTLTLQLEHRRKLQFRATMADADEAIAILEKHRDAGAWHGGFEFSTDSTSDDFGRRGLITWYEPVLDDDPRAPRDMSPDVMRRDFEAIAALVHTDMPAALKLHHERALAADAKVVDWSDEWMRTDYTPGYHKLIDRARRGAGSEMLSEIHVPRSALPEFLNQAAGIMRHDRTELIYSLVRLIERDDETFLAWARQAYACVIFNFHTQLERADIERNAGTFRKLLDAAIRYDGSYYLTYHRFARADQVEHCYPQMRQMLEEKSRIDPDTRLDSDWYQAYRAIFA